MTKDDFFWFGFATGSGLCFIVSAAWFFCKTVWGF